MVVLCCLLAQVKPDRGAFCADFFAHACRNDFRPADLDNKEIGIKDELRGHGLFGTCGCCRGFFGGEDHKGALKGSGPCAAR